jgi:hypothetical protein
MTLSLGGVTLSRNQCRRGGLSVRRDVRARSMPWLRRQAQIEIVRAAISFCYKSARALSRAADGISTMIVHDR